MGGIVKEKRSFKARMPSPAKPPYKKPSQREGLWMYVAYFASLSFPHTNLRHRRKKWYAPSVNAMSRQVTTMT